MRHETFADEWQDCHFQDNPPPPALTSWYVGLDLGQAQDYTAMAAVEKTIRHGQTKCVRYACRDLQRFPLGTPYPAIVENIICRFQGEPAQGKPSPLANAPLIVDA